jgi:hypothetical protein
LATLERPLQPADVLWRRLDSRDGKAIGKSAFFDPAKFFLKKTVDGPAKNLFSSPRFDSSHFPLPTSHFPLSYFPLSYFLFLPFFPCLPKSTPTPPEAREFLI